MKKLRCGQYYWSKLSLKKNQHLTKIVFKDQVGK